MRTYFTKFIALQPVENSGYVSYDGDFEEARLEFLAKLTETFGENYELIEFSVSEQEEMFLEDDRILKPTLN